MRADNTDLDTSIPSPPAGSAPSVVGKVLEERFAILEFVGQGGMSQVYRARHLNLNKDVAIKMLSDAQEAQSWQRFLQEAKVISKFDHPNVVKIHAFSITDGAPYLVMDFLQGKNLKEILSGQPMEFERAMNILSGVTRGLVHAHEKDVIHRDLKSTNILVVEEEGLEVAKIVDFGIAKCHSESAQRLTKTGAIVGTPTYMSPEQLTGQPLDARSDLYSLGCVFYETLSGKVPFERESAFDLAMAHLADEVPPLPAAVPLWLSDLTMQLLSKRPEDRIQTAKDVLNVLQKRVFTRTAPAVHKVRDRSASRLTFILLTVAVLGACFLAYLSVPKDTTRSFESSIAQAERKLKDEGNDPSAVVEALQLLRECEGILRDPSKELDFYQAKLRVQKMVAVVNLLEENPKVPPFQKVDWLVRVAKHFDGLSNESMDHKETQADALQLSGSAVSFWERGYSLRGPDGSAAIKNVEDFHDLPQAYVRLGAALADRGRFPEALKAFESAERYEQRMRPYSVYHLRACALIMSTYHNSSQHSRAEPWAVKIQKDFLDSGILGEYGLEKRNCMTGALLRIAGHYEIEHNIAAALMNADRVINLYSFGQNHEEGQIYTEALVLKGRVYADQGKWDEASTALRTARKYAELYYPAVLPLVQEQLARVPDGKKI